MTQTQSAAQTLRLPEVLNLTYAGPLAESLLPMRGAEVALDAAEVQRVGAQCVQVIMSAIATWKADDVAFCIADPSREFRDALSLLGVGLAEILTEEATR
jgi:chemotaxis protein CheX